MIAISTDSVETQKKFKDEYKLPYTLLSDEGGKVAKQYSGTIPVAGYANRATFVVDQDGTLKSIVEGSDAIDPAGAITSCPIRRKAG